MNTIEVRADGTDELVARVQVPVSRGLQCAEVAAYAFLHSLERSLGMSDRLHINIVRPCAYCVDQPTLIP